MKATKMSEPTIKIVRNVPLPTARYSRRSKYREYLSQLNPPKNGKCDSIIVKFEDNEYREFSCPYEIAKELKMKVSYRKLDENIWQVYRLK